MILWPIFCTESLVAKATEDQLIFRSMIFSFNKPKEVSDLTPVGIRSWKCSRNANNDNRGNLNEIQINLLLLTKSIATTTVTATPKQHLVVRINSIQNVILITTTITIHHHTRIGNENIDKITRKTITMLKLWRCRHFYHRPYYTNANLHYEQQLPSASYLIHF